MRKRLLAVAALMAISVMAVLSGCAKPGPILVEFQYQPPEGAAAAPAKMVVGVSPLKDDRGKVASVVGKRTVAMNDEVDDLVIQGVVADKVTDALKAALKARGFSSKDFAVWDLTDAGIPADGAQFLISGEIKKLWVESASQFANTTVKAAVELRISVADTAQKKVVRVVNVSSATEQKSMTFSTDLVQETLAAALSSAVDRIFMDDDVKKILK